MILLLVHLENKSGAQPSSWRKSFHSIHLNGVQHTPFSSTYLCGPQFRLRKGNQLYLSESLRIEASSAICSLGGFVHREQVTAVCTNSHQRAFAGKLTEYKGTHMKGHDLSCTKGIFRHGEVQIHTPQTAWRYGGMQFHEHLCRYALLSFYRIAFLLVYFSIHQRKKSPTFCVLEYHQKWPWMLLFRHYEESFQRFSKLSMPWKCSLLEIPPGDCPKNEALDINYGWRSWAI